MELKTSNLAQEPEKNLAQVYERLKSKIHGVQELRGMTEHLLDRFEESNICKTSENIHEVKLQPQPFSLVNRFDYISNELGLEIERAIINIEKILRIMGDKIS